MGHRKLAVRLALALVAALAVAAPVQAAGATAVSIEVTGVFGGTETFTTTGGVLCPEGTATTEISRVTGSDRSAAGSFHGEKTLVCADGTGTFTITFDAATVFGSPQDQGGWHVVGGTGDYVTLRGGGNLVGTYIPDGIIDRFTGRVKS